MSLGVGRLLRFGSSRLTAYQKKTLGLNPGALIGYWPLNSPSGYQSANDLSSKRRRMSGVNLAFGIAGNTGSTSLTLNGSNSDGFASLGSTFDGNNGGFGFWLRASNTSVWSTAAVAASLYANGSNRIQFLSVGSNLYQIRVNINAVDYSYSTALGPSLAWFYIYLGWSSSNIYHYINGSLMSSPARAQSWAANPTSIEFGAGASCWLGYISDVSYWSTALSAGEVAALATVP